MTKRKTNLPEINLIPLIDTLFCILFFYMTFAIFSPSLKQNVVSAQKTARQDAKVAGKKVVHVWVKEGGHVLVDGREFKKDKFFLFFRQNKERFSFVSVGGENDVRVREILQVINWLKEAGVSKINFRTK